MSRFVAVAWALAQREMIRFFRQRSRLLGACLQPLVFWLLVGGGFSSSFRPGGTSGGPGYVEYLYPGILAMAVLFTAIFSTIAVVEDRRAGFLQAILVSPAPRSAVIIGQAWGASMLALMEGILLLSLAPVAGIALSFRSAAAAILVMGSMAFGLTGLGLLLAWRLETTQGFHAIMNLAMMPMWMLSGALFPASGAPEWLAPIMRVNPMTYGLAALRRALYDGGAGHAGLLNGVPPMTVSILAMLLFAAITLSLASVLARRASA